VLLGSCYLTVRRRIAKAVHKARNMIRRKSSEFSYGKSSQKFDWLRCTLRLSVSGKDRNADLHQSVNIGSGINSVSSRGPVSECEEVTA
jgi:hypothetical protein